jgi:transcription elongation factor Elf1
MTARRKPILPEVLRLLGSTPQRPLAIEGALDKSNRNTKTLSDLAADILRSVGTHRCNDCGDSITVTAAAGVAEFAAYHRWLGRHERCDEIDRLRDESQAIADRRAAAEGRVAL